MLLGFYCFYSREINWVAYIKNMLLSSLLIPLLGLLTISTGMYYKSLDSNFIKIALITFFYRKYYTRYHLSSGIIYINIRNNAFPSYLNNINIVCHHRSFSTTSCLSFKPISNNSNVLPEFLKPNNISKFNLNLITKGIGYESPKNLPKISSSSKTFLWLPNYDVDNWLPHDSNHKSEYKIRNNIIKVEGTNVSKELPMSKEASYEVFCIVINHLLVRYPKVYHKKYINNKFYIVNKITKFITSYDRPHLLQELALLSGIDYTILHKGQDDKYYITNSASLFAIGWIVNDRIGNDLIKLHNKAPGWQKGELLYRKNVSIFDNVKDDKIYYRTNIFLVNTRKWYMSENNIETPLKTDIGNKKGFRYKDIYIRRELQTAIRIPNSKDILFTVKTYMDPMINLEYKELVNLDKKFSGMDSIYHNYNQLKPVVKNFIEYKQIERTIYCIFIICILFFLICKILTPFNKFIFI